LNEPCRLSAISVNRTTITSAAIHTMILIRRGRTRST